MTTLKIIIIGGYPLSLINFRGSLIKELTSNGHKVIACAFGKDKNIEEKLNTLNCRYIPVIMDRVSTNPFTDIKYMLKLSRIIRKEAPDIVLTYTIKPLIWGSIAATICKVKNICPLVTGLGYAFNQKTLKEKIINRIVIFLYKNAFRKCKKVAFQNSDNKSLFEKLKIIKPTQGFLVNGSGVDLNHYKFDRPLPKKTTFLLIARILKDKGIIEYSKAAEIINEKYDGINFLLVGPVDVNPMALNSKELQNCIKIGNLNYLGPLDDVRSAISNCSVLVLPSYSEGTPRSVLEAMSMGRAIITTDAPGCRETVKNGYNGFLVKVADHISLVEAMEKFILDNKLADYMGMNSLQYAKEKFDVNLVNKQIFDFIGLKP